MVTAYSSEVRAAGDAASASAAEYAPIVQAINAFDLVRASSLLDRQAAEESAVEIYYRSRIQILTGDLADAGSTAERCVSRWPESSLCHEVKGEWAMVNLVVQGNVFKQLGDSRKARRSLERSVELDPDNLRARVLLVRYYSLAPWFIGGGKDKARAQVEACRQRDPFWGHEAAALLALAEGRYTDAVEGFKQAQALDPEERDPAVYLAKAYSQAGNTDAAIEVLEELVGRYPSFHDGWLELGKLAAAQGLASPRGTAALEYFLANEPEASSAKRATANLYLGQLHAAAGRNDLAAAAYAAALSADPESREARKALRSHCRSHPETSACSCPAEPCRS
jgi:tetratricopeptide (TPR) repeat protein